METIYYHVTGEHFEDGDNLMTRASLADAGITYESRPWDDDNDDKTIDDDMICLYETIDDAREHLTNFGGSGIVAVTLDVEDDMAILEDREIRMSRNGEGFVCVSQTIPARYIAHANA